MKIVLASASPRRKELLTLIGLEFVIKPANIAENFDESLPLVKKVEKLAGEKAEDIVKTLEGDYLVLAADTIVEIDGKILGKPKDHEDAKGMLRLLSGKEHNVITAIALIPTFPGYPRVITHEITKVKFKELSEREIENYVAGGEPMDKAGAYAIQGTGVMIVEGIAGCYTNVVGLPVPLLTKILAREFNIRLL
jgi:septum formation protein